MSDRQGTAVQKLLAWRKARDDRDKEWAEVIRGSLPQLQANELIRVAFMEIDDVDSSLLEPES